MLSMDYIATIVEYNVVSTVPYHTADNTMYRYTYTLLSNYLVLVTYSLNAVHRIKG